MAIQHRTLETGSMLAGTYKKERYECRVEEEEGGKQAFVLGDGRRFKSPSAAASAVMDGKAVNGWLFWTLAGVEATQRPETAKLASVASGQLIRRLLNQKGIEAGKARYWCNACMKSFVDSAGEMPTKCTAGHGAIGEEA